MTFHQYGPQPAPLDASTMWALADFFEHAAERRATKQAAEANQTKEKAA